MHKPLATQQGYINGCLHQQLLFPNSARRDYARCTPGLFTSTMTFLALAVRVEEDHSVFLLRLQCVQTSLLYSLTSVQLTQGHRTQGQRMLSGADLNISSTSSSVAESYSVRRSHSASSSSVQQHHSPSPATPDGGLMQSVAMGHGQSLLHLHVLRHHQHQWLGPAEPPAQAAAPQTTTCQAAAVPFRALGSDHDSDGVVLLTCKRHRSTSPWRRTARGRA